MTEYPLPLELMIEQLGKLPGVGKKTAAKYAFKLLSMTPEDLEHFTAVLLEGKRSIRSCRKCFNLCTDELCPVCLDEERNNGQICVVEDFKTLMAIERARGYKGRFHVLGGALSPIDGIGPDKLHIAELAARVKDGEAKEIIIATNPTIEGEATAMYLMRLLKPLGVTVTRLAYGMPVGADLEYADEVTLMKALEGRKEI
ncbi:MAG: recombination protein RecR [Clostridia bacterium]|nr:recombination protein RecR [Clostridia bacterium]